MNTEIMIFTDEEVETEQRAADRGRVTRAWRWFSSKTLYAATYYRDLSWAHITIQIFCALSLIVVSRINPTLAVAPWVLVASVIWSVILTRIVIIKSFGAALKR